jgi:CubicO group peptidase (beta-lactamase class C family)
MNERTSFFGNARSLSTGLATLGLLACLSAVQAQGLPKATPEQVGLSSQRLSSISDWLRSEVGQKKIPGAVLMVVRGGRLAYVDAIGQRDPASPAAMKADDIFRIYSMTKPIVSVGALMLVEEGKLLLEAGSLLHPFVRGRPRGR